MVMQSSKRMAAGEYTTKKENFRRDVIETAASLGTKKLTLYILEEYINNDNIQNIKIII